MGASIGTCAGQPVRPLSPTVLSGTCNSSSFTYTKALKAVHPNVKQSDVRRSLNRLGQLVGTPEIVESTFNFAASQKQEDQHELLTRITKCDSCHEHLATAVNKPCNHRFLCSGCSQGYRKRNNGKTPVQFMEVANSYIRQRRAQG